MSFRRRIALAAAAAVAIAVVLASLLTYLLTSDQLHSQVDTQLRRRGASRRLQRFLQPTAGSPGGDRSGWPSRDRAPRRGGASEACAPQSDGLHEQHSSATCRRPDQVRGYQQVVSAGGHDHGALGTRSRCRSTPRTRPGRRTAASRSSTTRTSTGSDLRMLRAPFGSGRAVEVAQPLTEVDSLLSRLRLILALLVVGGIALAALLGRLVAGAALAPLRRLTQATEHVTLTQDLSGRIEPAARTSSGDWRAASTRCSTRSSAR